MARAYANKLQEAAANNRNIDCGCSDCCMDCLSQDYEANKSEIKDRKRNFLQTSQRKS